VKTTILVDFEDLCVLDCHLRTTRKNDLIIGPDRLEKHPEITTLVADKGYDTDDLRELLKDRNDRPLILHREYNPIDETANARINEDDYYQRSKVDSVIKRLYGDRIRARTWYRQFRKMLLRMVIYNPDRIIKDHFLYRTDFRFDVRHQTACA